MLCNACLQHFTERALNAHGDPTSRDAPACVPSDRGDRCAGCGTMRIHAEMTNALLWKLSQLARFGLTAGPPVMRTTSAGR